MRSGSTSSNSRRDAFGGSIIESNMNVEKAERGSAETEADPIDILVSEHRLLDRLATAFSRCANEIESGGQVEADLLCRLALLLSELHERSHLAKEESLLIPMMIEHGVSSRNGVLSSMDQEHLEERRLVREILQASGESDTVARLDVPRLIQAVREHADHARQHMAFEEDVVFPLARAYLSPVDLEELGARFAVFQDHLVADGLAERMTEIEVDLERRTPIRSQPQRQRDFADREDLR